MFGAIIAVVSIPMYEVAAVLAFGMSLGVLYGLSAHPFSE